MRYFICFPSSKAANPFVHLLNEQLSHQGWIEYSNEGFWLHPLKAIRLRKTVALVHFHWPEYLWRNDKKLVVLLKASLFIGYVTFLKLLGYKISLSMHNLIPHFGKVFKGVELYMRKWLLKHADIVVGHSSNVYQDMMEFYAIKPKHYVLALHGLYDAYLEESYHHAALSSQLSAIPFPKIYLSYSSHVYKGSKQFLMDYSEGPHEGLCLVLSGAVGEEELNQLKHKKVNFVYHTEQSEGIPHFLSESSLATLIKSSTVVALPYQSITTSGAYFLALTFGKPVMAPKLSFFTTTVPAEDAGFLFEPHSKQSLWQAMIRLKDGTVPASKRTVHELYNWSLSASELARSYDQLFT